MSRYLFALRQPFKTQMQQKPDAAQSALNGMIDTLQME